MRSRSLTLQPTQTDIKHERRSLALLARRAALLGGGGAPQPLAVQGGGMGAVPLGVAPRHSKRRAGAEAEHGRLQKSSL